jgi:hypothetical protein
MLKVGMAVALCAWAIAACGSGGANENAAQTATGASQSASLVRYSECMRSHGVTGFPDPSTTQGPNAMGIDGFNFNLPAGMNLQTPVAESAQKVCSGLIAGSGGHPPNPAFMARARRAALAHAQCMREHGVPNFPDPTFSADGGGVTISSGGRGGIDPRSPAFQQAQRACQGG